MEIKITRPQGTEDVTPKQIYKWHTVERIARETAESFGFHETRIPTFENTNLFLRSVGETTDVVQKEMYTVTAKETQFTLRPEGTAGTIRSMLQNGLLNDALPQKVFYILSCFRHERPQKGRLREFHQFGVEMAGSQGPASDAEIISLAKTILDRAGLQNIALNINSIGCPVCRAEYHKALKAYFEPKKEELCETCQTRLEKNPMRILDCKSPICAGIAKDAPVILDYLCDDCRTHFEKLQEYLKALHIDYSINPKIVRGLDYYTKTVFEFITTDIGAQGTVCGGGRYDGLVEEIGGPSIPAVGFGMGIERVLMLLDQQNSQKLVVEDERPQVFVACLNQSLSKNAFLLMEQFRRAGLRADMDHQGRSLKAQFKYADKLGAQYVAVLGDDEVAKGVVKLRNMQTRDEWESPLKTAPEDLKAHLEK